MSTKTTFEAIFGGFEVKNGGFGGVLNLAMGVIFVSRRVWKGLSRWKGSGKTLKETKWASYPN